MSISDVSLITCVQDYQDDASVNNTIRENVFPVDDVPKNEKENLDTLCCFVCDVKVQGRRYALATCKTQNSRTRVIEKLGELVGERFVVVISEDDVICRSCANLINTLDRLESEIKGVKSSVLRLLEQKYSLAEGELLRCSEVPRLGQPPQITRNNGGSIDYQSRKRGPVDSDHGNSATKRNKKSNVWMQCDKCRYTTLSDTFMAHHIRKHIKKKLPEIQSSDQCWTDNANDNNCVETDNLEEEPRAIQTAPLETIDLAGTSEDMDEDAPPIPVMSIPSSIEASMPPKDDEIQLISLTNPNTLQFQNFLANDTSLRDGQPLFMRVLQQFGVSDDLGHGTLIPVINNDGIVRAKENSAKQMLTLAEDGSLEMVAVDCWNDDNQTDQDPEPLL